MHDKRVDFIRVRSSDSLENEQYLQQDDDLDAMRDCEDAADQRQQWSNPIQFFMTILGFCVGLGNIWRFPYLCQQNGGGAFVLPFLIMLVLEGMPLLLLELAIGQKMKQGSLGVWNSIHPMLGGIGIGSSVIAFLVGCYYNMIIAWCIYYLINSFWPVLPWSVCPTVPTIDGGFSNVTVAECEMSSETQYFWYREALHITDSIDDFGGIRWWMILCLILAWIMVYGIVMKGIQSSGKVVYFTALFPYIVLTIFFIRGLTLKGSGVGLAHMFYPKLDSLLHPTVWLEAATQVFYSYGLAFGSIISFGSYNAPKTNCVRDVFMISICNAFTAVYACAVIFAILGFKAQHLFDKCMHSDILKIQEATDIWANRSWESINESEYTALMSSSDWSLFKWNTSQLNLSNCSIENELNAAAQGTGLAFIVMADVFTMLPGAPFWSLLFFSMLLSLGLGSQIGVLEGILGTICDLDRLKSVPRPLLTGITCLLCFCIGIIFTSGSGEYWLTLFDAYSTVGLTLIALTEILAVMYVYGHQRFTSDIEKMTGVRPGLYWQITWRFLAPILLVILLVASIIDQLTSTPTYSAWNKQKATSEKIEYPSWALMVAIFLALASVIPIALVALIRCIWRSQPLTAKSSQFRRTDTNASTRPMMDERGRDDLEFDRRSQSSESSDPGIVVSEEVCKPRYLQTESVL